MSATKTGLGIKLSPERVEEFNNLCAERGCSQPETLAFLLDLQKLQAAAETNPQRAELLSSFRAHVAALVSLQEASLVLAEDAKACAREEFSAQLAQNDLMITTQQKALVEKDATISALQQQLGAATDEITCAANRLATLVAEHEHEKQQHSEARRKLLSLAEEAEEIREVRKAYQKLLEETNELRRENKALSDQIKDAQIAHANEIRKLEAEMHQAQLEAERRKWGGE